jgi:hypothetical protein
MADTAAHVPAGPRSDSSDAQLADTVSDEPRSDVAEDPIASTPRAHSAADGHADAVADDVELIGWQTAPSSTWRSRELVAVGAGDTEGPSTDVGDVTPEPSRWSGPRIDVVDDTPQWSFPGVAADLSAPPAPPPAAKVDRNQSELPFATAAAPALGPPRPTPTFGPVGRARSTLLIPVLSVLTLGLYALIWHHDVNREMEEFDPKLHSRPRRSTFALLVPWLVGLLVTFAGAAVIITSRLAIHLPFDTHVTTSQAYYLLAGLVAVPYLVLLLPFSAVAVVMTLERLRSVEEHVGATTDRQVRPVGTSLLLAIPVVGGLALLALEQRRLNQIWQTVAPSGHRSS